MYRLNILDFLSKIISRYKYNHKNGIHFNKFRMSKKALRSADSSKSFPSGSPIQVGEPFQQTLRVLEIKHGPSKNRYSDDIRDALTTEFGVDGYCVSFLPTITLSRIHSSIAILTAVENI